MQNFDANINNIILSLALPETQMEGFQLSEEDVLQLTQLVTAAKKSSDFILSQLTDLIVGNDDKNQTQKINVPDIDSIMGEILENETL